MTYEVVEVDFGQYEVCQPKAKSMKIYENVDLHIHRFSLFLFYTLIVWISLLTFDKVQGDSKWLMDFR